MVLYLALLYNPEYFTLLITPVEMKDNWTNKSSPCLLKQLVFGAHSLGTHSHMLFQPLIHLLPLLTTHLLLMLSQNQDFLVLLFNIPSYYFSLVNFSIGVVKVVLCIPCCPALCTLGIGTFFFHNSTTRMSSVTASTSLDILFPSWGLETPLLCYTTRISPQHMFGIVKGAI